jgi:hypothetical protein
VVETPQRAVSFPDFMAAVMPQTPMARANRQGNLLGVGAAGDHARPEVADGNYPNAIRRVGHRCGVANSECRRIFRGGLEEGFATREQVHAFHGGEVWSATVRRRATDLPQLGDSELRHRADAGFMVIKGSGALDTCTGADVRNCRGSVASAAKAALEVMQHPVPL